MNYSVVVNTTGYTDSDWAVAGSITISNPAPIDATINSVADVITGPISPTLDNYNNGLIGPGHCSQ